MSTGFISCADASLCYDHAAGACGGDGTIDAPECASAVPFCDRCFPNSLCGGLNTTSAPGDGSGDFVESSGCTPDMAGCAEATLCFDHALGLCSEDGSISAPECVEASQFCRPCFPKSRCGSGQELLESSEDNGSTNSTPPDDESSSGTFVEGPACPPELAGCAEGGPCYDHSVGLCLEDGSIPSPACAEAVQFCNPCFPNSRCGGGGGKVEEEDSDGSVHATAPKNLPLYSVLATTLDHVTSAVSFAGEFGIPLSVKATGASYSVANQADDNLLIVMGDFPKHSTGLESSAALISSDGGVMDNYVDACGTERGPAIEIGGGETFGDAFASLVAFNEQQAAAGDPQYMLSSGAAVTVGAAGGWLMGGGLGPFDRSLGLGIDNVIAYHVVTAPEGKPVIADECNPETSDLFWALKGGGGGSLGVVVSQISKLHPLTPLVRANVMWMGADVVKSVTDTLPDGITLSGEQIPDNLAMGSIGTRQPNLVWTKPPSADSDESAAIQQLDKWWDAMLTVLNPVTMDPRIDGYYGVGCAWAGGYMCADLYFLGTMDEFESMVLKPLREVLGIGAMPDSVATVDGPGAAGAGSNFIYIAQQYTDGYYKYASQDCVSATEGTPQHFVCTELGYPSANGYNTDAQVEQGGYETRLSWMIPDWIFGEGMAGNPPDETTVERAKALFSEPLFWGVTGHVLGGNVNSAADEESTSTSPVMRSSALEGLFPLSYIEFLGVQESMDVLSKHLPAGKSGPIFNHDALNLDLLLLLGEPANLSWQDLYWGSNLPRLQKIKAKYDTQNLFQCRDCVTAGEVPKCTCEGPDGAIYCPGESFPASDGCNTCSCTKDGLVGCTEMACLPVDEGASPSKNITDTSQGSLLGGIVLRTWYSIQSIIIVYLFLG